MILVQFICSIQLLLLLSCIAECFVASERAADPTKRPKSKCKADAKAPWSYRGVNGPNYWGEKYPACNGKEQSPIAISSLLAVPDKNLSKLFLHNYDTPVSKATIENNGHTVQVTPKDNVKRTIFVDGDMYRLHQVHFHWGTVYYNGSEHTIDGVAYALEMHLIHKNTKNQLAAVGVFFQEQSQTSREMQNVIKEFPDIMYGGKRTDMKSPLNLNKLLPANPTSFYRYSGSLTTPGCDEGVTWSVIPTALPIGMRQMYEFRKLYSATKNEAATSCKISGNYRPIQPAYHRRVLISQ